MTRPLPASVLLLPAVTARLIKSTWDQRNILISWERIAVFSASVLSHKFVYKSGRRWQEFHRRFWSKRRVGDGGQWFDIAVDGILQFAGGAMNTPPDLLLGQGGEPALDQVQPRGAGRREVHMEPRMTSQPAMNQGRFVSAIVVQNQVNIQNGRHRRLDAVQELAELYRAVPGV